MAQRVNHGEDSGCITCILSGAVHQHLCRRCGDYFGVFVYAFFEGMMRARNVFIGT